MAAEPPRELNCERPADTAGLSRSRGAPARVERRVRLAARLLILLVAHDLALLIALEAALALLLRSLRPLVVLHGTFARGAGGVRRAGGRGAARRMPAVEVRGGLLFVNVRMAARGLA